MPLNSRWNLKKCSLKWAVEPAVEQRLLYEKKSAQHLKNFYIEHFKFRTFRTCSPRICAISYIKRLSNILSLLRYISIPPWIRRRIVKRLVTLFMHSWIAARLIIRTNFPRITPPYIVHTSATRIRPNPETLIHLMGQNSAQASNYSIVPSSTNNSR